MLEKRYDESEKKKYVEGFKNSTYTLGEYARRNNLPTGKLKDWLKEDRDTKFGTISLQPFASSKTVAEKQDIKFECENIKIELKANFDKDLLKKIMEVLLIA